MVCWNYGICFDVVSGNIGFHKSLGKEIEQDNTPENNNEPEIGEIKIGKVSFQCSEFFSMLRKNLFHIDNNDDRE